MMRSFFCDRFVKSEASYEIKIEKMNKKRNSGKRISRYLVLRCDFVEWLQDEGYLNTTLQGKIL